MSSGSPAMAAGTVSREPAPLTATDHQQDQRAVTGGLIGRRPCPAPPAGPVAGMDARDARRQVGGPCRRPRGPRGANSALTRPMTPFCSWIMRAMPISHAADMAGIVG